MLLLRRRRMVFLVCIAPKPMMGCEHEYSRPKHATGGSGFYVAPEGLISGFLFVLLGSSGVEIGGFRIWGGAWLKGFRA